VHRPRAPGKRRDSAVSQRLCRPSQGRCRMTPTIPLRKALADPALLANALPGESRHPWRVMLIAAMGEALTDDERKTFFKLTSRTTEPLQRVEELAIIAGRRGGKSRATSTLAT